MRKKEGYGVVYQDVTRNSNISAAAKGLYAYLSAFCGASDECYPSVETIIKEMSMSRDTFYRHINALVAAGIVEKQQTINDGGKFGCTVYRVTHEVAISDFPFTKNEDTDLSTTKNKETKKNNTTNNNIKNNSKDSTKVKKSVKSYFPDNKILNQSFIDYVEMRKKIKKPMTDRAIELAIKKLNELAAIPFSDSMDNKLAIQILNQSVMNSWQGLFPLREQKADYQNEKGGGEVGTNGQSRGQAADFYEQFLGSSNGD